MSDPSPAQTGTIYKVAYDSKGGALHLRLFGRDVEGRRIDRRLTGVTPYFFVNRTDAAKAATLQTVTRVLDGPPSIEGELTSRVEVHVPTQVRESKGSFRWHGEADVLYGIRERVDRGLVHVELPPGNPIAADRVLRATTHPKVTPRNLRLDIEVDDHRGYGDPENAPFPVLSVAFHDSTRDAYGVIYTGAEPPPGEAEVRALFPIPEGKPPVTEPIRIFRAANERVLFGMLANILEKVEPDIASAWNGYEYDFPYLGKRAETLNVERPDPEIWKVAGAFEDRHRRTHGRYAMMDPMVALRKKSLRQRSLKLNTVAMELLGYGKVERPGTVAELRRTDLARFLAYNLFDVVLLRRIDEHPSMRLTDLFLGIAEFSGVETEDIQHNSRIVDGVLFGEARVEGHATVAFSSKDLEKGDFENAKAAAVFDPVLGMHLHVLALDTSQEYPSIIQTFNISPDSRVPVGTPDSYVIPDGNTYRRTPLGIIPRAVFRLKKFRDALKNEERSLPVGSPERLDAKTRSEAAKAVVNSFAGVLGSEKWRIRDKSIFEDITRVARLQLAWNRDHLVQPSSLLPNLPADSRGIAVMGDTDSCYVTIHPGGQPLTDSRQAYDLAKGLLEALNATYPDFVKRNGGATTNYTSVGIEGIFGRLRILPKARSEVAAKKRYYGLYDFIGDEDVRHLPFEARVKYSGIEVKRWNNAKVTKDAQKKIVEMDLTGVPEADIVAYYDDLERRALAGEMDNDLLIPAKLGSAKYDPVPDFIRAIRAWDELSGQTARVGDEFHWTKISPGRVVGPNGRSYEGGEFGFPLDLTLEDVRRAGYVFEMDRPRMVDKTLRAPCSLIFPDLFGATQSVGGGWA